MKFRIKEKQYIYTHECQPNEKGKPLSKAEMRAFFIDCLIKSYEMRGSECIRHTPDFNSEADFSYNKFGKTVCGVIILKLTKAEKEELFTILSDEDKFKDAFPQLYKGYYEYNSYPVFYFTNAKCLDTEDGSPVAGGRYEIEWNPVQPLYQYIPTSGPNISEFEMYQGYARSWETGDISFIKNYVNSWFKGESELSFESTTSKAEQIELIKSQHEKWEVRNIRITTRLIKDKDSGDSGILMMLNGKPTGFVVLEFRNYRISKSKTRVPPTNYVDWEVKHELYQTHGDHHAPFVVDKELPIFLTEMLEKSSAYLTLETDMSFDDTEINTKVASLKYPADKFCPDIAYLALIAYNPKENVNEFVTCYPYLKGSPVELEIIDVLEWSNKIEATIKCKYCRDDGDDEFVFHFFATDYYFNKDRYQIGEKICIALAASSGNAKEASRGFTFEGQKAIDFLAKTGRKPTYNENGEVEPVRFSTEQLVAFLPHDDKCPDMAEFQSPANRLVHDSFYQSSINVCFIKLHKDLDLEVPLYFNNDFNPKDGDPVTGWIWLSGRIADPRPNEISVETLDESLCMVATAENFITELQKLKERSIIDVTSAFRTLSDLSIGDGRNMFAVRFGNIYRYNYELFPANFSELAVVQSMLDSDGFIDNRQHDKFKQLLAKSGAEIKGVGKYAPWQYFLVDIAGMFMPYRKYYSPGFSYILTGDDSDRSSSALNEKQTSVSLMPSISRKETSGFFTVMAWSRGRLLRRVYAYAITNRRIRYSLDGSYQVEDMIENDSDESNLRFRE